MIALFAAFALPAGMPFGETCSKCRLANATMRIIITEPAFGQGRLNSGVSSVTTFLSPNASRAAVGRTVQEGVLYEGPRNKSSIPPAQKAGACLARISDIPRSLGGSIHISTSLNCGSFGELARNPIHRPTRKVPSGCAFCRGACIQQDAKLGFA